MKAECRPPTTPAGRLHSLQGGNLALGGLRVILQGGQAVWGPKAECRSLARRQGLLKTARLWGGFAL